MQVQWGVAAMALLVIVVCVLASRSSAKIRHPARLSGLERLSEMSSYAPIEQKRFTLFDYFDRAPGGAESAIHVDLVAEAITAPDLACGVAFLQEYAQEYAKVNKPRRRDAPRLLRWAVDRLQPAPEMSRDQLQRRVDALNLCMRLSGASPVLRAYAAAALYWSDERSSAAKVAISLEEKHLQRLPPRIRAVVVDLQEMHRNQGAKT